MPKRTIENMSPAERLDWLRKTDVHLAGKNLTALDVVGVVESADEIPVNEQGMVDGVLFAKSVAEKLALNPAHVLVDGVGIQEVMIALQGVMMTRFQLHNDKMLQSAGYVVDRNGESIRRQVMALIG